MNADKFEDLKSRLIDHHIRCIGNDATYAPLFQVQVKKLKLVWKD